jgi:uncharacterized protein YjiS (DUF1127 family)
VPVGSLDRHGLFRRDVDSTAEKAVWSLDRHGLFRRDVDSTAEKAVWSLDRHGLFRRDVDSTAEKAVWSLACLVPFWSFELPKWLRSGKLASLRCWQKVL